jgi:hypothetical protein
MDRQVAGRDIDLKGSSAKYSIEDDIVLQCFAAGNCLVETFAPPGQRRFMDLLSTRSFEVENEVENPCHRAQKVAVY